MYTFVTDLYRGDILKDEQNRTWEVSGLHPDYHDGYVLIEKPVRMDSASRLVFPQDFFQYSIKE